MKISNTLSQFNNYPVLFIVSGNFEAHFYVARDGIIEIKQSLMLNPREEAKEKQGFINESHGLDLGAVSHHERYMEDLKNKFNRKVNDIADDIMKTHDIKEICLIAPRHNAKLMEKQLNPQLTGKLHTTIFGSYTKKSPIDIVKMYDKELARMHDFAIHVHQFRPILKNGI